MDRERLERMTEHLPNCPDLVRVYVSRETDEIAHPRVTKLEAVIGDAETTGRTAAGPAAAGRRDRSRGRRDHLLHLRHDRQAEGRARHPARRQLQHHGRAPSRRRARSCGAARRRRRPIRTRRSGRSLISVPFFHVTGCFAVLNPGAARRRQAGDDAQVGRRSAPSS